MYKKTAQLSDLTYANLTQMSNQDSYNSLYRLKLSGQSNTSPILRWTGNSPIWGKITVPTRGSSTDDSPTHADLAYANLVNKYDYSNPTYQHNIAHPRENDQPHVRPHLEKSSLEYTRTDTANYTCDRNVTDILESTTSKMDQHAKSHITVNK